MMHFRSHNHNECMILQVCGIEALKQFSQNFIKPYKPSLTRGTIEELEQRVSLLRSQLKEAESELQRLKKGKEKAWSYILLWDSLLGLPLGITGNWQLWEPLSQCLGCVLCLLSALLTFLAHLYSLILHERRIIVVATSCYLFVWRKKVYLVILILSLIY